jgi:hypothetical protein
LYQEQICNHAKKGFNRFNLQFQADWYFAKLECKVKGMELVSIESAEEQDVLAINIG